MPSHVSLYEEGRGGYDTDRRGGNVITEAEIGGMWPQAKGGWQPPEVGRAKKQILP